MVFKDNFVAVVVCNGKILREHDGAVTLPFGSDYSLKLKNLESRKALVNVSIDGNDVLNGNNLVIPPSSETVLDGFMDGHEVRNRFRFIQKTKEIVEHRGDRLDDGVIRVEYRFEQHKPVHIPVYHDHHWDHHHYWPKPYYPTYPPDWLRSPFVYTITWTTSGHIADGKVSQSTNYSGSIGDTVNSSWTNSVDGVQNSTDTAVLCADISRTLTGVPNSDEGITVRGEDAHRHFDHAHIGTTESQSHVITIKLRGTTDSGVAVEKPVTTKTKLICPTCGKTSKSSQKFCGDCGTRLLG